MLQIVRNILYKKPSFVYSQTRHRSRLMSPVPPPSSVKGMLKWQTALFETTALIPCLLVDQEKIGNVRKSLDDYLLKMFNMRPVQESSVQTKKLLLLNPSKISHFGDLKPVQCTLDDNNVSQDDFSIITYNLTVDNWTPNEIMKAVLPEDQEGVSGFSIIGHVIHLNLKENLSPFKEVIGNILLRTKNIRTVVNKSNTIDNTFRNFNMELLAGDNDFFVTVKEGGCTFTFDFSKVYWNPRLSTEHERIVKLLNKNSVLFDACAGVGPFAVPAGKICKVFCNDLNPESFKWLVKNIQLNKKSKNVIECQNLDARIFIRTTFKSKLVDIYTENVDRITNIHVVMNLPALAISFLNAFQGLLHEHKHLKKKAIILPQVHVYGFTKSEKPESDIQQQCELNLGVKLDSKHLGGIYFVRNVAPNKDMYRASFLIPQSTLFDTESSVPLECSKTGVKRSCSPVVDEYSKR